jgi:hypothetical protein
VSVRLMSCVGGRGWGWSLRGLGCLRGRWIGFGLMMLWCGGGGRIRGFVCGLRSGSRFRCVVRMGSR